VCTCCISNHFLHRLWKDAAVCTQILEGHSEAITSARFINKGKRARNNSFLLIVLQKHLFVNSFHSIVSFSYYVISDWHYVGAGVETESSLHVVTGSKDRSLRLYKVNVQLFVITF
jgi:ribosome biogenesis protein YTM1